MYFKLNWNFHSMAFKKNWLRNLFWQFVVHCWWTTGVFRVLNSTNNNKSLVLPMMTEKQPQPLSAASTAVLWASAPPLFSLFQRRSKERMFWNSISGLPSILSLRITSFTTLFLMARFGNKGISQNAFLLWLLLEVCKLKIGPIFPKNYIKLRPDMKSSSKLNNFCPKNYMKLRPKTLTKAWYFLGWLR